jgi:hypothetical protein
MLRPGGYAVTVGVDGQKTEADTFTCAHCQRVVMVKPKATASECGGWCGRCAKPICPSCAAKPGCAPFEKQLERIESRARLLKSITGS